MRTPWTKNQLIEVLKLYCVTPFGRLHSRNPDIISLAAALERTPSAVALKAVNFASLDPTIDRKGMSNASALDREVWMEFFANIDAILEKPARDEVVRGFSEIEQEQYIASIPEGLDVHRLTKTRQNQSFFREMVLTSYDSKCALSGIAEAQLLNASHIVPWRVDPTARTNPRNGIRLNALHDRAFDRGLISFDEDLKLIFSPQLSGIARERIEELSGSTLTLPSRFRPDPQFLHYHRTTLFKAA